MCVSADQHRLGYPLQILVKDGKVFVWLDTIVWIPRRAVHHPDWVRISQPELSLDGEFTQESEVFCFDICSILAQQTELFRSAPVFWCTAFCKPQQV